MLNSLTLSAKVEDWDTDCVCIWLAKLGCSSQAIANFKNNHVTGPNLKQLDESVLKNELMLQAWGDRDKILQWLRIHKAPSTGTPVVEPSTPDDGLLEVPAGPDVKDCHILDQALTQVDYLKTYGPCSIVMIEGKRH